MDYMQIIMDLISYMQREDVLSSDSKIYGELADILGLEEEDVHELLD